MGTVINCSGRSFMWDITAREAQRMGIMQLFPFDKRSSIGVFSNKKEVVGDALINIEKEYRRCRLCPLDCRIDRTRHVPPCTVLLSPTCFLRDTLVSEERIISPSYSVFFQGCNLKCVYCHAQPKGFINHFGQAYDPEDAADDASISVTAKTMSFIGGNPDNSIKAALETLFHLNRQIPVVWNTNFYVNKASLDYLHKIAEVYTVDLKAYKWCGEMLCGRNDYFPVVSDNIKYLIGSQPESLLIIRHLMLPNHFKCCTEPILHWIKDHAACAKLNLMDSYFPCHSARQIQKLNRILTEREIEYAKEFANNLGLDLIK